MLVVRWADSLAVVAAKGWERLATIVGRERLRLGYRSLRAFAAESGLSPRTLDSIEHHRKTSYDPATLSALESALGWRVGSVERVLKGLDPQPIEDKDLEVLLAAWPKLPPSARRMLAIQAAEGARAED